MKDLLFLFPSIRHDWIRLLFSLLLMPLAPLLLLLQPWLLKQAIDGPYAHGQWSELSFLGGLIIVLVFCEYLARSSVLHLLQSTGQRNLVLLRERLVRHVLHQSQAFFDKTPLGAILTRLTADVETINDLFATGVVEVFLDVLFIIGLMIFLFTLNAKLALLFFILVPAVLIVMNFFRAKLKYWFNELRVSMGIINAYFEEAMRGLETIQTHLSTSVVSKVFLQRHQRYFHATVKNNVYDCYLFGAMEALVSLALAWLLWNGLDLKARDVLTLGTLVAFIDYAQKLFIPIKEFSGKMAIIQRSLVSIERLRSVLENNEQLAIGTVELPPSRGVRIEAKDLCFAYKPGLPLVADHLNFLIESGQVVALVGETGSGKTSLTRLVTRQYDGFTGTLKMNGQPVADLTLESLRQRVAIVQQDAIVFTASVLDNIRLFKVHVSEEACWHALKKIQADDWVRRLPQGLHTIIGPQGFQLSAGQQQLLQLARLFVFPANLVVMDEATSQVDTHTEQQIQLALEQVFKEFTSIVVAHRLSTILRADQILVFKEGRIVERGRHWELLERRGVYYQLTMKQFEAVGSA